MAVVLSSGESINVGDFEPLESIANGAEDSDDSPHQELIDELGEGAELDKKLGEDTDEEEELDIDSGQLESDDEPKGRKAKDESDDDEEPASRSGKRIRQLIKERDEMREQFNQYQAQAQQRAQEQQRLQQQQTYQYMQRLAQQNQLLQQQVEQLSRQREDEADEANLPVAEVIRKRAVREAEEAAVRRAREEFGRELGAIKQQLQAEKQQRETMAQEAEKRKLFERYDQETAQIRQELFLNGADPNFAKQYADTVDEMILTYGASFGLEPREAGPMLKKFLDAYAQMDMARRAKTGKEKLKKGKNVVPPMGAGRQHAKGEAMPSLAKLQQAGYANYVEWMRDGEPPIS